MKLYAALISPFARCAAEVLRVALPTTNVEKVFLNTQPFEPNSDLLSANPIGKVPALLFDDGARILDSRSILFWAWTQAGMKPEHFEPGDELFDLSYGVMDVGVALRYELGLRPQEKQDERYLAGGRAKLVGSLSRARTLLAQRHHVPVFTRIALVCAVDYVRFRLPELLDADDALVLKAQQWSADAPELAASSPFNV